MGGGHVPTPVAIPKQSSADVQAAAEAERQRIAKAMGRSATILGGDSLGESQQRGKTLLGQ